MKLIIRTRYDQIMNSCVTGGCPKVGNALVILLVLQVSSGNMFALLPLFHKKINTILSDCKIIKLCEDVMYIYFNTKTTNVKLIYSS